MLSDIQRPVSASVVKSIWRSVLEGSKVPSMSLGMNVAWINSWAGSWVFSNLMYHAAEPERTSGTSTWSYDQGEIQVDNQTDKFRIKLADTGNSLPAGTYTVINPDGLKIHIGGYNEPYPDSYTTALQFTYEHAGSGAGSGAHCLHIEGSLTAELGNLAVILPGHLESWNSGSVWNKQFLDFHRGLKLPVLRLMDWTYASQNVEANWGDRSEPGRVTLRTPWANGSCVPYEYMCDLARVLRTDIWVCVPHRATAEYVEQMANLFDEHMPAGQKVWLETGNEVWNDAPPWGDGTGWVMDLYHTKRTAVADFANQRFTLQAHGLTNGEKIHCYSTAENRALFGYIPWQLGTGVGLWVKVIDANSFEVHETSAINSRVAPSAATVNLLFAVEAEPGKTRNLNKHFGELSLRNWNAFDSAMGESRVVRLLSAMAANLDTTSQRLAVPGVVERASAIAIAPYFTGTWFGAAVDCSNGQLTPRFWASESYPVHMAVYPREATPTALEVVGGKGAISKQEMNYVAGNWINDYVAGTPATELENGGQYRVWFAYVDNRGVWAFNVEASPSAEAITVYGYDSHENQAMRHRLDIESLVNGIEQHKAAANSTPVLCYEGGLHFHHNCPPKLREWLLPYMETAIFADTIRRYITEVAAAGSTALCYYGDVLGTTFSIANSFTDTVDARYQAFAARNGYAAVLQQPDFPDIIIESLSSEPETPYSWHTLGSAEFDYEIVEGNQAGSYAAIGGMLTLVDGSGIEWSTPAPVTLKIRASNSNFTRTFSVMFATGNAWYEADSKFAWDSKSSADNSQISPVIGNTLARSAGSGALISNGLWDMSGNVYSSSAAAITGLTATKPILWAAVLDKATHGNNIKYSNVITCSSGNFMAFYVDNGALEDFRASGSVGSVGNSTLRFAPQTPEGPHVFWIFYDPTDGRLYAGYDQVGNGSVAVDYGSSGFGPQLIIGGSSAAAPGSQMKHGSMQIINRTGMTLVSALEVVAKMQAHHGIV